MDSQLALYLDTTRPQLYPADLCSDEERAVAAALRWGSAAARQVPEIAAAAGLPARRVQTIIKHLVDDHGWPVGTSMSAPFGNYLIDSAAELDQTVELLRTRGISILARAAALNRTSLRRFLEKVQADLDLEAPSHD
ncbi:MAG TPA: hypothetical protein VF615_25740 [Longimicrobiaceae bacterium]